ncbi:DUF2157 domain-containing protein, partial [Patescibacteria group bacterium]|nr:DUF2157 domain-containing protein [Patescibacteria group bacterium]
MMSPLTKNKKVFQIQGTILMGVSGLILTLPYLWNFIKVTNINIGFAVFYLLLLLLLIRGGNLVALAFFCLTIFRFYVDTFYDFMPKSAFFLLGGIMLLGFGWYFENRRRKQGGIGFE